MGEQSLVLLVSKKCISGSNPFSNDKFVNYYHKKEHVNFEFWKLKGKNKDKGDQNDKSLVTYVAKDLVL